MFLPALLFSSGILIGAAIMADAGRSGQPIPHTLGGSDTVPPSSISQLDLERIQVASTEFLPYASAAAVRTVEEEGPLQSWKKAISFLPGLTEAVAIYFSMMDENTPIWVKAISGMALAYSVSPDLIPDFIPIFGQADDIAVIFFTYRHVSPWITQEHYGEAATWLRTHGIEPKPFIDLGDVLEMEKWAMQYAAQMAHSIPQLTGPSDQ